jgi:hypothetical protein
LPLCVLAVDDVSARNEGIYYGDMHIQAPIDKEKYF